MITNGTTLRPYFSMFACVNFDTCISSKTKLIITIPANGHTFVKDGHYYNVVDSC